MPISSSSRLSRPRSSRTILTTGCATASSTPASHQFIYYRHYNRHAAELWWKHREILRAISRRFPTSLSRRVSVLKEHRELIERIRAQDADGAAAVVARHVEGSGRHILEQMGVAQRNGTLERCQIQPSFWFQEDGLEAQGSIMKITDLRVAVIGKHPIIRIVTDEGIYGLGEVEYTKTYLKPFILHFRDALIGEDPTDVERCMMKIRHRGSFKPYGAAVSVPSSMRCGTLPARPRTSPPTSCSAARCATRSRVYNGSVRKKRQGDRPEDFAADVKWMAEQPEGFFMVKQGIGFHSSPEGQLRRLPLRPARARSPAITAPWTRARFPSTASTTCSIACRR